VQVPDLADLRVVVAAHQIVLAALA